MTQAEKLAEKGFITATLAAEMLGRHITSVYRLVEAGSLEGLRIGRSWYVKRTSLVEYANKLSPNGALVLGLVTKRAR